MLRSPLSLGAAVALAGLLTAAAPATAAQRPGERYDGRVGGLRNHVVVSPDGARLRAFQFHVAMACSDRTRRTLFWTHHGERPVLLDAAGRFERRFGPGRMRWDDGARGHVRMFVSGEFDEVGDTVSGTVSMRFDGRGGPRCRSGALAFTLHRNGTPGAPFSDARATTALYRADGAGVFAVLKPHVPSQTLDVRRLDIELPCGQGRSVNVDGVRYPYLELRRGRFAVRERGRGRLRGGGRFSVRAALRGRFLRRFDQYVVEGTWEVRVRYDLPDGRTEVCAARRRFSGAAES